VLFEPKMPCSRYTLKPVTATTITATITAHRRRTRLPTETLVTR